MPKIARWERSRNRHGLWIDLDRVAYIGKEYQANRWHWSLDYPPYTCGTSTTLREAKSQVHNELRRIQLETPSYPRAWS